MTLRYCYLILLFFAPALVLAQDSVNVVIGDVVAGGWEANFGAQFTFGEDIGPLPLVPVEGDGTTAPPDQGCDPLVNGDEIEGNIAWISRGSCAFVLKVQNAAAAGAVAVLVHNDERNPDDFPIFIPPGFCTEDGEPPEGGCSAPAAFVTYQSHLAIEAEMKLGELATISCPLEDRCLVPPEPPAAADITSSTVASTIFADGFIGKDFSFGNGQGFAFNGEQGLFVSTLLVSIGGDVTGNPYDGASEYEEGTAAPLSAPFPAPFTTAEAGAQTTFSSDNVDVTLSGYGYDGFVIYDVKVTNASGGSLDDVYLGLFADFDAGTTTSVDDNAGFNENLNLAYVYDPVEAAPYFGVLSLGDEDVSGYSLDATTADDAQLFDVLTTANPPASDPAERAAVVGVGPYDVAAGKMMTVRFALVAGEDEADLFENAMLAKLSAGCGICPSVEKTTEAGRFVLETPYPNPAEQRATVRFILPEAAAVQVVVYDVLGREVTVLAEGVRLAGEQAVTLDTAGLPSGVYVVRLDAGVVQLTQRLTIIR